MLHVVKKLYHDSRIRYLFFGGCTTLVNLGLFAVLKGPLGIDYRISNFFSVAAAICFAFVVNKLFVFQSKTSSFTEGFREFIRFVLGRLVTMAVEVGGVPFCVEILHQPEMIAKLETQVIVTVVNYFISKFLVFKSTGGKV
ncbi:GtrA family protein [Anaerostipes butyraticus]|uniref:Teichoic acid glycosylation protein GtcA n=1 Tax=Anaerostipes butyraticus TaxID=645466 RepID=A0A916Q8G0_9FIRM|nr:GtrA family protein [Anaerostipes butyraticus]GFO86263.1 teichoic acid glycosylation protein GtcA [Anaerostipes butyraticus]